MKNSQFFIPNTKNKGGYEVVNQLLTKHVLAVVNSRPQTCSLVKPHAHVNASRKRNYIHVDDIYIDQERSKEAQRLQKIIAHMKKTYVDNREPNTFNLKVTNLVKYDKNVVLQDHARNVKSLITKIDEINKKSTKKIKFIRKNYINFPSYNHTNTMRNFRDDEQQKQQRSSSAFKKKSLKFKSQKKLKKMQSLTNNDAFNGLQSFKQQQQQVIPTKSEIQQQPSHQKSSTNNSCYDLYDISQKADKILQRPQVSDLIYLKKICKIKKLNLLDIEQNLTLQEMSQDPVEMKKQLKRNILDVIVQKQIYNKNALREVEYIVVKNNPNANQQIINEIFTELQTYIFK